MSARFTKAEAAAIDAMRGDTDRSAWLRALAIAALTPEPARKPVQSRNMATPPRAPVPPVSTRLPKAPPAPVRFREPDPEPNLTPMDCKHPRVHGKGACPDCFEWVTSKP
jgi:hypothetical protein